MRAIVDVAVPYRVSQSFHYLLEDSEREQLEIGSILEVPFRKRTTIAYVIGFPDSSPYVERLRPIERILSASPQFDGEMFRFLKWVSHYYCHPLGEVLAAALPKACWTPAKRRAKELVTDFSWSGSAEFPDLTIEQKKAVDRILASDLSRPILLHGVTGSGKTEVYLQLMRGVVEQGKGAIVLVPEIALTPQLLGRFSMRFPGKVAVLHSELTAGQRRLQWERVSSGEAPIVVGARSAIFAPVKNLGLIVVDEEHEGSFKQEDSLRYHARDLAVVRSNMVGARTILGSATPSLESYLNAEEGKYEKIVLSQRVNRRAIPITEIVDLKNPSELYSAEYPWLSRRLIERVTLHLEQKNQVLLYLNRLGYAHFLYCPDCGHSFRCPNCDVSLTYYKKPLSIQCHYCGLDEAPPTTCPQCSCHRLEAMGVGTEQVEAVLNRFFPEARVHRMDRSVVKNREQLEQLLEKIADRKVDILVGTQMTAKGHDFPGITLVGVLVADASLNMPDFRAFERTFQTLTQVSGRAGRGDTPGEVILQTLNPTHPVLLAAAENRMDDFYEMEMSSRRGLLYPPFSRLALVRFQHRDPKVVEQFAESVAVHLRKFAHQLDCSVLGPSQAPLSRLKALHRWQCLLKSGSVKSLQQALREVRRITDLSKTPVDVAIDVDPVHLL